MAFTRMTSRAAASLRWLGHVGGVVLFASLIAVHASTPVYALLDEQRKIFDNSIMFFNYEDDDKRLAAANKCNPISPAGAAGGAGSITPSGSDNESKAYNYLKLRNLAPHVAAGITANLVVESGVDPNSNQNGGGPGRGIAQWETGAGGGSGRWDTIKHPSGKPRNVKDFAANPDLGKGRPMTDLTLQLDFLMYELENFYKPTYDKIVSAPNEKEASFFFMNEYEAPRDKAKGGPNDVKRGALATDLLKKYDNGVSTPPPNLAQRAATPGEGATQPLGNANQCGGVAGPGNGNVAQKAIELAWPKPFGGAEAGRASALTPKPEYAQALAEHNSGARKDGADCGVFVATVMRASGADPKYPPVGTAVQYAYLVANPALYTKVEAKSTAEMQPGDIAIVTAGQRGQSFGHTWIYVGPQAGGFFSASASLGDRSGNIGKESLNGFTVFRAAKTASASRNVPNPSLQQLAVADLLHIRRPQLS